MTVLKYLHDPLYICYSGQVSLNVIKNNYKIFGTVG